MIAFIQGRLSEASANRVVVDVGGVGYEVALSSQSFQGLPRVGETVRLLIYQHVREDTLALYGFLTNEERDLFKLLLGVSGIGPKVAINILSGITAEIFYQAVRDEDLVKLSAIPGIGRKTAERIVVELKEKAVLITSVQKKGTRVHAADAKQGDALRALIALGYRQGPAQAAVEKAMKGAGGKKPSVEDLVKEALKLVGSV